MKPILSLYALKGIACLMVVMGHIPSIVRSPLSPILRGVPLFLMISGYLLYTPNGKELSKKAMKQLKKICCIILCVHAVYAIYSAVRAYFQPTYIFPIQTWEEFFNWFFCGIELGHGVLWYLHTYAWTLIFLWALSCRGSVGYIRYLPYLLVANLVLGRYQFVFPFEITHFGIRQNCFTVGLPYFAIGYLVHEHESRLLNIPFRRWMSIMLCCLIAVYAEIVLLTLTGHNNHFADFIFNIPLSITLFAFMVSHPTLQISPWLVSLGRNHSANIYYWHMMIAGICSWIGLYVSSIQVVIVFALSLLLSVAISAVRKKWTIDDK